MHYFDHMATTALRPEALEAMLPYLREEFGNPQSIYPLGSRARQAVERAREQVAAFLGARPEEIIFTSSGAEANNLALRGLAQAAQKKGQHVIVSRMEHHSVLNSARVLERMGFAVTFLSPDRHGLISPQAVEAAMTPETVLVSIIHASPEVGTIEPIAEIAQVVKARGALMHTDCVASAGQLRLDVQALGVDALSISAHIFYGPKGAGALYLKRGTRIVPLIYGGIQESGRRAGTENVPAIVGMGVAAELAQAEVISHLKIDGSLTTQVLSSEEAYKIVRSTVKMAKSLGLRTVAEYVESRPLAEKLLELEVDYGQGYYFAPPLSVSELMERYAGPPLARA